MKRTFDNLAEVAPIRRALIEGEQSGEPEPFDFAAFRQRKVAQHPFQPEIQKATELRQLVSRIYTRYRKS